jgi:hypothetical protein
MISPERKIEIMNEVKSLASWFCSDHIKCLVSDMRFWILEITDELKMLRDIPIATCLKDIEILQKENAGLKARITNLREALYEVSLPAYKDSDYKSLFKVLNATAITVLKEDEKARDT